MQWFNLLNSLIFDDFQEKLKINKLNFFYGAGI
jgi:hypothetical protein